MTDIRGRLLAERRRIRDKFEERQPLLHKFFAKIGDGEGNIYPDLDDLTYIFIRRTGRGRVERVRNTKVKAIHGLNVIVGYAPELPDTLQVLDIDDVSYGLALGGYSYVKNHHQQHELLNPQGGGDTTWIYTQQFLYLLCQVTDPPSATLRIRDGRFMFQGEYKLFPGQATLDMTTFAPGANEAVMVLISIDAGTLVAIYTASPAFSDALPPNSWFSQVPVAPDLSIPVAAVYVPNGATIIDWDYILDWRVFVGTVGDVQPHNILSATHSDTLMDAIVRGDILTGLDTTPIKLGRLAIGAPGDIMHVNAGGTDAEWGTPPQFDDYVLRSQWLQNGFVDEAEVSLAWDDASRTLTVDSVGANFNYFHDGILYTRTGPDTEIITDTEGMWVFYYDGAVLTSLHNPNHAQIDAVIEDQAIVAYLYWNAVANDGRLMYELHGYRMSPVTHHWLHDNIGAVYRSGMALADFVIDDSGDDDEDAQFSVASGEFYDEDLEIELAAVGKLVGLEIWYTVAGDWRWITNAGFSILTDVGTGRMAYNNAGAQAPVDNNNFALCHIYATSIVSDAGADPKYIAIQGIAQYANINAARTGADTEINALTFGTLPLEELVPVGTIIFQTANGYLNAVQSRTRTTDSGDNYVDWRGSSIKATGGSVTDHGSLAGLADDDHVGYPWLDGRAGGQMLVGSTLIAEDLTLQDNTVDGNTITVTQAIAAFTHISSDGTDHTYINQDLRIAASPTFANAYVPDGGFMGVDGGIGWLFDDTNNDISTVANIGLGITNPATRVEIGDLVAGTLATGRSTSIGLCLNDTDIVPGDEVLSGLIAFTKLGASRVHVAIGAVQEGGDADLMGMVFQVHDSGTAANPRIEAMRIASNGNVGIGTTDPDTRLDIGSGAIEMEEMSAPGGGAVNTCRLYCVDNGGKTELYAIFNTGAAQLIAAQP